MIIRLIVAAGLLSASWAASAAPQDASGAEGGACVSCLILHIPAVAAGSAVLEPGDLEGLTLVLDGGDPAAGPAVSRLRSAGATVGIVVPASTDPSTLATGADLLIVMPESHDAAGVFAIRTLTSAARAAHPGLRILLAGEPWPSIAPYVDGRAIVGPRLPAASVDVLVGASEAAGAEPVLLALDAVDWPAVKAFAARRAFGTAVVAQGALSVERIVARHQAWQRRQDDLVRRTVAHGSTTILFEVPGYVAPVTVTAATVVYRGPALTEVLQRDIRVNGAAIAGGGASSAPKLPLIEAERVATPPLAIVLDDAYTYELVARERVGGGEAYVVRFEPRMAEGGLASGRAWIDTATYALRRLVLVQHLRGGPIVSSTQEEEYGPFAADAATVWLPVRTQVFQMYEGAGHRTPIHRTIVTPDYLINPGDFEQRLQAAYASPHLMLRDTPQGFRYLLRREGREEGAGREVAPRAGERIRTAVAGVLLDPNITVPLPFAGLSYVDLNLFDTGAQLNAFFGGAYGQVSWSIPSLAGTRWQAYGRAFAIAVRYNDRAFRGGVEQYRENITQRPAHLSTGMLRPLGRRVRLRVGYEFDYTAFDAAETTAADFLIPADAVVHGMRAALEVERGPWTARVWGNPARRQGWRAWGLDAGRDAETGRSFVRFGAGASRTLALGRRVASRVEAEWVEGARLDRFSRYRVDAFENRLHGYPTASLRYDRGAIVRTVASWSARGWRLDTFADLAAVRDPGFGPRLRAYPGVGAALEVGGPLATLWSVDWGYGFRAPRSGGGTGTQAVRITAVRAF